MTGPDDPTGDPPPPGQPPVPPVAPTARNAARIAQWRERRGARDVAREQHADLPTDLGMVAVRAAALAVGAPDERAAMLAAFREALAGLPHATIAQRRQTYDALARGLERGLEEALAAGTIDADFATLRRRQMRTLVRLIEADARTGLAIVDPAYVPTDLAASLDPLASGYARRAERQRAEDARAARRRATLAGEAYTFAIPPEDEGDLTHMRAIMAALDGTRKADADARLSVRAQLAMLRYQFVLLKVESRIALLWNLMGPAVLLALISSLYFVTGTHAVLDMDVATFAMVGATTWIMFRNVIFRTSTSFSAQRAMLNLRPINPLAVGVAQGLIYVGIFQVVFALLIGGGLLVGLFTPPNNPALFEFWVLTMGFAGICVGTIFGAIAVIWPFFLRFAPAIERALELCSSVFFVSEQLPRAYRPYVLWSPFAHALQLIRQAYFASYQSTDASPVYYSLGLALLAIIALAAHHLVRSRAVPM